MAQDLQHWFRWTDGSAANYLNWGPTWGPNEPNLADADCADMGHQGLWGLETCTVKSYFVCQTARPYEKCLDIPKMERVPCG